MTATLCCQQYPTPHTAQSGFKAISAVFTDLLLSLKKVSFSCQDTTGNSIEVFNDADWIVQSKCLCHLLNLIVQWLLMGSPKILEYFENEKFMTKKIGCSPKRLQAMSEECKSQGVKFLMPILGGGTRWNGKYKEMIRYQKNRKIYDRLRTSELFAKKVDREHWENCKESLKLGTPIIERILPVLEAITTHTVVLEGTDYPTGCLVRASLRSIFASADPLKEYVRQIEDNEDLEDEYYALMDFVDAFDEFFEKHCGPHFSDLWWWKVAAIFDPRVLQCEKDPSSLFKALIDESSYLTEVEKAVPPRIVPGHNINQRSALAAMAERANQGVEPKSPVMKEIETYCNQVCDMDPKDERAAPLIFWARQEAAHETPILCR